MCMLSFHFLKGFMKGVGGQFLFFEGGSLGFGRRFSGLAVAFWGTDFMSPRDSLEAFSEANIHSFFPVPLKRAS